MTQCLPHAGLVTPVDAEAVYVSPLGKRCRVLSVYADVVHLIYDRRDGKPAARSVFSEGFNMTLGNARRLRRVE